MVLLVMEIIEKLIYYGLLSTIGNAETGWIILGVRIYVGT
jgi:hypothetical protein